MSDIHMLRLTTETHERLKTLAAKCGVGMAKMADALLREGLADQSPTPRMNPSTVTLVWHPSLHRMVPAGELPLGGER